MTEKIKYELITTAFLFCSIGLYYLGVPVIWWIFGLIGLKMMFTEEITKP